MNYQEHYQEGMSLDQFNETVDKIVQSEGDKIRTKYSKEMNDLKAKLPKEKSDSEIDLENRLKELERKESEYQIKDKLTELGLPQQLAGFLKGVDGLEQLKDVFNENSLKNSFKPNGHKSNDTTITKEQFKKMDYSQREQLFDSNPELYKALSK